MRDPLIREELKRASVWFGLALAIAALIFLAQPLLLIFAGIVLASMLDGGTRLLGRVLPIGRGWRLAIVTLAAVGFIVWTFYFAGTELVGQAERLREVITAQANRVLAWGNGLGIVQGGVGVDQLSGQLMGTLGRLGSAVSSALGVVASTVMILVIGIFIAVEPRLYQRGVAWMMPLAQPRALLQHRRAYGLHPSAADGRAAGRDGGRGRSAPGSCSRSAACRWRPCSASSPACSPSSPISARSSRAS